MAPTPAPSLLIPVVSAVAGFGAGLLGGAVFAGSRTPPPSSAAPDFAPVVRELQALREELRRPVTSTPAARRAAPDPAAPAADVEGLAATVAELVRAVETLAERASVFSAQRAGADGVLAHLANRTNADLAGLAAVARAGRADHDALQAQWMFVPATEILRRFGRPTNISAGQAGGAQWEYDFEAEGDSFWVGFTIVDGYVARVD